MIDDVINTLKGRTLAIGSGKGGVGKTTTAVNLAIYYARKKLRTGLIDLDPASNIETVLGIAEVETLSKSQTRTAKLGNFTSQVYELFSYLDLIFPYTKLNSDENVKVFENLYRDYSAELEAKYEILIFDLPAGARHEDNLAFLNYVGNLVVVTNAEPPAHVSAGGYIKNVLDINSDAVLHLWHNKFEPSLNADFNPKKVVENYNKNVPEELRIDPIALSVKDIAFIPKDPSLDLLQGNLSVAINTQRGMLDMLGLIQSTRISRLLENYSLPQRLNPLIKYFFVHEPDMNDEDNYLDRMLNFLNSMLLHGEDTPAKESLLTGRHLAAQKLLYKELLTAVKQDPLRNSVLDATISLQMGIGRLEDEERPFYLASDLGSNKELDKKISMLLLDLNRQVTAENSFLKNSAGLLLFYFSLYKLFQSQSVLKILYDFIPTKKNSGGRIIRDKYEQIKNLVDKNADYRKKYFQLLKTLFPVLNKQIATVVRTFELYNLAFIQDNHSLNKAAYLKLFSTFLHDIVNSGLSVVVGFPYRPASLAFGKAAERLLEFIRE